ncbi:hypothetical protein Tco_1330498 [Tanacetum coccineum]
MSKASDDIQERELHQLQLMRVSERAFMTLFGQDNETFTSTMSLNLDQLQRQLVKDEFQEDKSMAAFWMIYNQFQKFIDWQDFVDYDSQMTEKFFAEYIGIKVTQFRETLLQHMGNVKKSVAERARHQRQYERRVNNRQMQTQESKIDSGSALDGVLSQTLDADLVVMESNGTESGMRDTSSSSGNYITHVVDANIRPIYNQVPFAEDSSKFREFFEIHELKAQLQAKNSTINNLKKQIKHVKEASNEAKVKNGIDVIETINIELEHSVAKLLAANEQLHKENEYLKQTYKEIYDSIKKTRVQNKDNRKPPLQPSRNHSVVRQPNAFKSKRPRISKPQFTSQFDKKNVLSKPVTPHYLPKVQEYVLAKPHHVIASGSSRNSQEKSHGSNDMAHNHYLEDAKKKTQERNRNSKPSVMPSVRLQNTVNDSTLNPKRMNQTSRSLPTSKSRPRSSMINDVCPHQFRPRSSTTNDVCSHQFRPRSSTTNDVCSQSVQASLFNDKMTFEQNGSSLVL